MAFQHAHIIIVAAPAPSPSIIPRFDLGAAAVWVFSDAVADHAGIPASEPSLVCMVSEWSPAHDGPILLNGRAWHHTPHQGHASHDRTSRYTVAAATRPGIPEGERHRTRSGHRPGCVFSRHRIRASSWRAFCVLVLPSSPSLINLHLTAVNKCVSSFWQ